jgi:glycosyltransferase involved in cell wall biosynthesis
MKIGFLTERMILGFGVDLVVHEAAKRFAADQHEVTVFTTRVGDIYRNSAYRIINLLEETVGPLDIFSPHFMTGSINFLSSQDIDVWIAETPPFYRWLPYLRPPVILVEHGTPDGKFFEVSMGRELDAAKKYRYDVIFKSLRSGDAVVAISDYIKSVLPVSVQENTSVIRNGGDHYPRAEAEATAEFRSSLGIQPDDVMILWVGRIEPFHDWQPYKGLKALMELTPLVLKRFPEVKIVALGRAEENARKPLEEAGLIPVFNVASDVMPAAFAAADIYLNTSRWEGFNLPLIEAQYQGSPAVAYNLCAHPEVVDDGKSGLLVNTQDEMLSALGTLISDPAYREKLAGGAESHAAGFTWDSNAEQLKALIQSCVATVKTQKKHKTKSAGIKKLPPYYLWKSRELIRRYGWKIFLKEIWGWLMRRLPPRRHSSGGNV